MAKAKISVTVDRDLLASCDRVAGDVSRSELVETALARWLRDRRRRRLEEELERYYLSMTKAEQDEDREWASGGAHALKETWR